ncbi:hypothetical protein D3C85_1344640 [compost metagenome]
MTEQNLSLRKISETLGIGVDAIKRIRADYNITISDRAEIIKNGVKELYGVDNVMDNKEIRERQKTNHRKTYDERGLEIAAKGWDTRRMNRFGDIGEE